MFGVLLGLTCFVTDVNIYECNCFGGGNVVKETEISQSEWIVLNVVWEKQPAPAKSIIEELAKSQEWSAATIRTFLHRLLKKGALQKEQTGNRYLYSAAIPKDQLIKQASHSFLDSVFGGKAAPLLCHFVQNSQLTPEEIEDLQEMLDRLEDPS